MTIYFHIDNFPVAPPEYVIPVTLSCDAKFTLNRVAVNDDGDGVEQTTVRREGAPGARVETAHCEVSTSGRSPESGGLNSRSDTLRAVTGFQLAAALARLR